MQRLVQVAAMHAQERRAVQAFRHRQFALDLARVPDAVEMRVRLEGGLAQLSARRRCRAARATNSAASGCRRRCGRTAAPARRPARRSRPRAGSRPRQARPCRRRRWPSKAASPFRSPSTSHAARRPPALPSVAGGMKQLASGVSGARAHAPAPMLDLEHVAIEIGDPLPALDRELEITERIADERLDLAPEEARILVGDVGRAGVAEPRVAADLVELVEQRVELSRVERVGELADEIGSAQQARLCVCLRVVVVLRNRKPRQLDGAADAIRSR